MVYYNPYKNIFRALMRAIRVFISSLFSKRLLLMIIVALVIMLLHMNVHAESIYQDGYAYRNIKYEGLDEDTNMHKYTYRIYTMNGLREGEFFLSTTYYNNKHWFVCMDNNDNIYYWYYTATSNDDIKNFYLNYAKGNSGNYSLWYSWSAGTKGISNCSRLTYDSENQTWGNSVSISNASTLLNKAGSCFDPSNILVTNNINLIYYQDANNYHDYNTMLDNRILTVPNLRFYTGTGFRLYLNQFEPFASTEYEEWDKNYTSVDTVSVYYSIYDLNNDSYIVNNSPLELQDYDEKGNLYVDLLFSDMSYMNVLDGDYLLFFRSNLNNAKLMDGMNSNFFNVNMLYQSLDYWRYTYYASSGAGILRAVYEDGTEKPNQDNTSTDEPSQGDTTSQAITELNNTINNQTTIIQEQTNTINEMSNFMQDDNFSSDSITNNMPSSDEFQDVTESGFDNIFTTLRNTFTSDNYQDVEFVVPFSNGQKIIIPSNLTENIIPTAIKTLIQMVYWYFIARFIVKDIASYIEKAKSGDIFSSSDTNIKTDML